MGVVVGLAGRTESSHSSQQTERQRGHNNKPAMASRYISSRYGRTRQCDSVSRASSVSRETKESYSQRSMSVSPFLSASQYTDSTYSRSKDSTASLLQQYSGQCSGQLGSNRGRYYQDKDKEIESSVSRPVNSPQNYLALKNSHLPIWTNSWRNYSGRGGQWTSQFLGSNSQRSTRLSTPTFDPPRVFIYHKSTVN